MIVVPFKREEEVKGLQNKRDESWFSQADKLFWNAEAYILLCNIDLTLRRKIKKIVINTFPQLN